MSGTIKPKIKVAGRNGFGLINTGDTDKDVTISMPTSGDTEVTIQINQDFNSLIDPVIVDKGDHNHGIYWPHYGANMPVTLKTSENPGDGEFKMSQLKGFDTGNTSETVVIPPFITNGQIPNDILSYNIDKWYCIVFSSSKANYDNSIPNASIFSVNHYYSLRNSFLPLADHLLGMDNVFARKDGNSITARDTKIEYHFRSNGRKGGARYDKAESGEWVCVPFKADLFPVNDWPVCIHIRRNATIVDTLQFFIGMDNTDNNHTKYNYTSPTITGTLYAMTPIGRIDIKNITNDDFNDGTKTFLRAYGIKHTVYLFATKTGVWPPIRKTYLTQDIQSNIVLYIDLTVEFTLNYGLKPEETKYGYYLPLKLKRSTTVDLTDDYLKLNNII